ncbi:MAG: cyclomaltodextrinase [Candidatus Paceibacteria bacterium]|jgi:cyclomaltodextrinase
MKLGKYKHYKGKEYEVISVAKHSETLEELVVYKALYNDSVWARPLDMFEEKMVVDGKEVYRFEYIG